ncbi:response regulator [Benzoatithermus flavus]|uniref:Response regulator n=1 Tax=Benzoatithermus flavus TaxID=3108223 RepID=A0ABU8XKM4_9PROT
MRSPACHSAAPRRLLIVGDVALSRSLMRMVLSRLDYVVTCVASAQEALTALAHTRFALALIALQLPDVPGLTLARRLRDWPEPTGSMPILLFGDAWDTERILEDCREARLQGYLPKPISIGRLVSTVCDLIQRAPSQPEAPTPMPHPPVAIERLLAFTDGDLQLEQELVSLYLATAGVYLDEMRMALDGGADWNRPAHGLKGASDNIGAVEMARLAAAAEMAPPSPAELARLEQALAAVRRFFRERHAIAAANTASTGPTSRGLP